MQKKTFGGESSRGVAVETDSEVFDDFTPDRTVPDRMILEEHSHGVILHLICSS